MALLFSSCTSVVCKFQDGVAVRVTDTIASTLECKHPEIILADVKAGLSKISPCKEAHGIEGPVANFVCPFVSRWVSEAVLTQSVPAAWGCQNEAAKVFLATQIERVCKYIPVEER